MVKRQTAIKIRKVHRYLGLFLGIQFLLWTVSGLYFSWTDIDDIHGDQFKNENIDVISFNDLIKPSQIETKEAIQSLELREIAGQPYYWINKKQLFNATTGVSKPEITASEALKIAEKNMSPELEVIGIEKIEKVGNHHEYRERPLPAYVISYEHSQKVKAYISVKDGNFQRVRHRSWRWFDFLWMTHTMDYEGRDNFNTIILRAFSLLGLITVLSGFTLWFVSSPTIRKIKKNKRHE
ncbi:putative iron-regulated membrane protein [Aquimarina sp. EL_43]|uniref:PepSY domain-containing protein n=1 Tax=unclassified Aquimarina TaxID=2627091 RepID=UPI0018C8DA77|nr:MULTISPECIES: PepSY domain-containing protein [unclassified Aquimarina]MBG6129607.1 putative iron-regulated membrane protein [Aquimarina sp. EL_35]MBG6150672.1 putative iron-regulated membrane protein [Aquimarina sp. EL_32]MBG6168021.1 putative iron-regulated membrane protein [Aquimarina sp. EL_43]